MFSIFGIFCAVSLCSGARARQVVLLETMTAPIVQQFSDAFLADFKPRNQNETLPITFVRLNARGSAKKAEDLLHKILEKRLPDLVVTVATLASKAAQKVFENTDVPIVFMCVTDPVGAGLIEKIGVPTGTRITGKIHYIPAETKVTLVKKVVGAGSPGRPLRFGYIYTDYPADVSDLARLTRANAGNDIVFLTRQIAYQPVAAHKKALLEQVREAVAFLAPQIDFFWSPRGVLAVLPEYDRIMLSESSIPLIVGVTEESVRQGALLHITGDPESQGKDAAAICRAILNGADPGEIVPSLPGKIQFSVNLKTAADLKLAIPSDVLELARGRIYR